MSILFNPLHNHLKKRLIPSVLYELLMLGQKACLKKQEQLLFREHLLLLTESEIKLLILQTECTLHLTFVHEVQDLDLLSQYSGSIVLHFDVLTVLNCHRVL